MASGDSGAIALQVDDDAASRSSLVPLAGTPPPRGPSPSGTPGGAAGAGPARHTSPLHPLQRRYTILPGRSHYACGGRIMQGPDWLMIFVTLTMLTVPGVLFLTLEYAARQIGPVPPAPLTTLALTRCGARRQRGVADGQPVGRGAGDVCGAVGVCVRVAHRHERARPGHHPAAAAARAAARAGGPRRRRAAAQLPVCDAVARHAARGGRPLQDRQNALLSDLPLCAAAARPPLPRLRRLRRYGPRPMQRTGSDTPALTRLDRWDGMHLALHRQV